MTSHGSLSRTLMVPLIFDSGSTTPTSSAVDGLIAVLRPVLRFLVVGWFLTATSFGRFLGD